MKKKTIWQESKAYPSLYHQIVKRFGPFKSWPNRSYPANKGEFEKFCRSFADVVGAKSGRAVENQIRWATTKQSKIGNSHMMTYLSNKMAALAAGFIDSKYVPTDMKCNYK
jgi:hypothetical protein